MAITKKEYVLQVVEQMKENPRAVLAGHGIQAAVLQQIISRPDIMSKLATILYSTKNVKKGAPGLKKANNFKISGYKNFADFNLNAREDVETFIAGLTPDDSAKFKNSDNIITILMLPQVTESIDTPEESVTAIISGKSVPLTFDTAVRREYKIAGGIYLTVMMGDSVIRPIEAQVAERKEKVNNAKQVKRTPAKIVNELKSKAKKKLAALDTKRNALEAAAFTTGKQLQQFGNLGKALGAKNPKLAPHVVGAINKANKTAADKKAEVDAIVAGLTGEDLENYQGAVKYMKKGNEKVAKLFLKGLGIPVITDYVLNGPVQSGNEVVNARKKEIIGQLKALVAKNEELLTNLQTAPTVNVKRSIQSMLSRNNGKIRDLRAALGTYKNISVAGMVKKAEMLKSTHAAIDANIKAGATIEEALNSAIAQLTATPAQKEIIKQQVIEQVSNGANPQYAVQQAIQDNIDEVPVVDEVSLSDDSDIQALLNTL